jgi:transposase-like protein
MPLQIEGVPYLTVTEILDEMHITRQTLWRWRQEGRIPLGRRNRRRHLLFTSEEAEEIRRYANRIEPVALTETATQLTLFAPSANRQSNT